MLIKQFAFLQKAKKKKKPKENNAKMFMAETDQLH